MRPAKFMSIVALLSVPFVAQLNAQTLQANIAGSSAFWLEAGQGAYTLGGTMTTCAWTTTTWGVSYALDSRVSAGAPAAATLQAYVQSQVSFGTGATHPEFIPDQQLNVFHAHFDCGHQFQFYERGGRWT
jgi:hypothetical protein